MTTQDEVQIRIGVDHRGVATGLTATSAQMSAWRTREMAANTATFAPVTTAAGAQVRKLGMMIVSFFRGAVYGALIALATKWLTTWRHTLAETAEAVGARNKTGAFLDQEIADIKTAAAEREKSRKADEQKKAEDRKRDNDANLVEQRAAEAAFEVEQERLGKSDAEILRRRKLQAEAAVKLSQMELERARAAKDLKAAAEADLDLQRQRLKLVGVENDIKQKMADRRAAEIARENALNEPKRQKLLDLLGSGAFSGELGQVAKLRADAALAYRAGNLSFAQTNLAIAGKIMRDIQSNLFPRINIPGKPEDALKTQLLDALAPIKTASGALRTFVENVE